MGGRAPGGAGSGASPVVVSDASPLISLDRIGRLDLLGDLFATVVIPPAVAGEVGPSIASLAWLRQRTPTRPLDPRVVAAALGPGESEAISLAIESGADQILLDDLPARTLANDLGLRVVGNFGLLVVAKLQAVIPDVRPLADALIARGFRLSPVVYHSVLQALGETQ